MTRKTIGWCATVDVCLQSVCNWCWYCCASPGRCLMQLPGACLSPPPLTSFHCPLRRQLSHQLPGGGWKGVQVAAVSQFLYWWDCLWRSDALHKLNLSPFSSRSYSPHLSVPSRTPDVLQQINPEQDKRRQTDGLTVLAVHSYCYYCSCF